MLRAKIEEQRFHLFWRKLKIEPVLHYSHKLHEFDGAFPGYIYCLKEIPKIESVPSDLSSDLHPHQVMYGGFVHLLCARLLKIMNPNIASLTKTFNYAARNSILSNNFFLSNYL